MSFESEVLKAAGDACFLGLTDKQARSIQSYLLAYMTGTVETPSHYLGLASCYGCIPKERRWSVKALLISAMTGTSIQDYLTNSGCESCILPSLKDDVIAYQYTLAASLDPSPSAILALAAPFLALNEEENDVIQIYLMNSLAGFPYTTEELVAQSKCYCVSEPLVKSFIIESTEGWTPSAPNGPEMFVQSITNNPPNYDVSMGFIFDDPSAVPDGGYLEIWRSTDGTTFTLLDTFLWNPPPAPQPSFLDSVSTLLSTVWYKARWRNASSTNIGPFGQTLTINFATYAWGDQIVTNGGTMPSYTTLQAVSDFMAELNSTGLTAKMLIVNVYAPDGLVAVRTPLIQGIGLNPWTNTGFLSGDLSVNGLKGDGATKRLTIGGNPQTWGTQNIGISCYVHDNPGAATSGTLGCSNAAFNTIIALKIAQAGITYYENAAGTNPAGYVSSSSVGFAGFWSGSRLSGASMELYRANDSEAFNMTAQSLGTSGAFPNFPMAAHALYIDGFGYQFDGARISFAAFHLGLNATETEALYNAVRALRGSLGGGYV